MPPTEYLPVGNQNFLFGVLLPPPGYSLDEVSDLRLAYEKVLRPSCEVGPGFARGEGHTWRRYRRLLLRRSERAGVHGGAVAGPAAGAGADSRVFKGSADLPGVIIIINQSSIFQRGFDEGRNIDIEITGPDLEQLIALGGEIFGQGAARPSRLARPTHPRSRPRQSRSAGGHAPPACGRARAFQSRAGSSAVSALIDGAKASDYQFEGREIDLKVMAEHARLTATELDRAVPHRDSRRPPGHARLGGRDRAGQRSGPDQPSRARTRHHLENHTGRGHAARDGHEPRSNEILGPMRREAASAVSTALAQRDRGQAHPDGRHAPMDLPAGHRHHLSADGGAVRELPLPLRHHVQRAAGGAGRRFSVWPR